MNMISNAVIRNNIKNTIIIKSTCSPLKLTIYVHHISMKQGKKKKLTIRKSSFYTLLSSMTVGAVPSSSVVSDFLRPHGL